VATADKQNLELKALVDEIREKGLLESNIDLQDHKDTIRKL
jgi:hypothetical protein